MNAAINGHENIVKFLLKKDAGVNHENDDGLTAAKLAKRETL